MIALENEFNKKINVSFSFH